MRVQMDGESCGLASLHHGQFGYTRTEANVNIFALAFCRHYFTAAANNWLFSNMYRLLEAQDIEANKLFFYKLEMISFVLFDLYSVQKR